jgi:hypothetical protein
MSLEDIAKKNQEYALTEQRFALARYPQSKTIGEALSRWHSSPEGAKIAAAFCKDYYEERQRGVALGNADTIAKGKGYNKPRVQHAKPKAVDWSDDKAATAELRRQKAEQAASLSDEHSAQRHNSGAWNNPLGERLNVSAPEATDRRPVGLGDSRDDTEAQKEARFVAHAVAYLRKSKGVTYDEAISAILRETRERRGW